MLLTYGIVAAIAGAAFFGGLSGLLSGTLVTLLRINPFIATLAVMVMVRGGTLAYTDTRPVVSLDDTFLALGGGGHPLPYAFLIMIGIGGGGARAADGTALGPARLCRRRRRACRGNGGPPRRPAQDAVLPALRRARRHRPDCCLPARLGTGSPIIGETTPLTAAAAALLGGASLRGGEGTIAGAFAASFSSGSLLQHHEPLACPPTTSA